MTANHTPGLTALFFSALLSASYTVAETQVTPEQAVELLAIQSEQFEQQVVKISEHVFTAVGYHGANTSMIVGSDGVIIVDTLMGPASASRALAALRNFSDKPVKAIIYTHSHADHTGGTSAFVGDELPAIYAMTDFGSAGGVSRDIMPIMHQRGPRQFGRNLAQKEITHRGIAPAGTEDNDRGKGYLAPTISIPHSGYKAAIAGVEVQFIYSPGETGDALSVWLPGEKVLFSGDNFYHAFPNLYAIRGTPYRNVLDWSNSVAAMAQLAPNALVPGHTLPINGQDEAVEALTNYSTAIRSIYDQTVAGINAGKGPDLLAHEVQLPAQLQDKPYLTEFYGTIPNAVRAIYSGLLGWFDGNPTTLNPLAPAQQAQKVAELAGGTDQLAEKLHEALAAKDYQWALELADHLKWLDDADKTEARKAKIVALRGLAAREYNAPNRNYYLSYANELESGHLSDLWF